MKVKRIQWFRVVLGIGVLLGAALLVESSFTYRYVTRHLVRDHLTWQAGQHLALLETRARWLNLKTDDQLPNLLAEVGEERAGQIVWVRISDVHGRVLAETGRAGIPSIAHEAIRVLEEGRAHSVSVVRATSDGEVLVVVLPFRFHLRDPQPRMGGRSTEPGSQLSNVAEIAVAMRAPDDLFGALRNNLAISMVSALALLVAMTLAFSGLPGYLRGRELEQQLDLAREVQQRLLTGQLSAFAQLEFATTCLPAHQVGGDYYDVFAARSGQVALVLDDVSGKGLPASLLMAHLHGAVRSIAAFDEGGHLSIAAHQLNSLMCEVTSRERFASLFWAYYDRSEGRLSYVNAGHLAPMLLRRHADGGFLCHRLEEGGPVLGLLPQAVFGQGQIVVSDQDLVVIYSDGLSEASNSFHEEFGEDRLRAVLETNWHRPVREIQRAVLDEVTNFVGTEDLHDDLTLLVARIHLDGPQN